MLKEEFSKLYKACQRNVLKRSLILSTAISSAVLMVSSLTVWFINKPFWIALIPFAFSELTLTLIFFLLNKMDDKRFAKKLDELGLKQRGITMVEFMDDDSLMSRVQRENAKIHFAKVDKKEIKLALSTALIVLLSVFVFLGVASTTVSALSTFGIISSGSETIEDVIPGVAKTYKIIYSIKGEGTIIGDLEQIVKEGESSRGVIAVPNEGYYFYGWSDKNGNVYRVEENVSSNMKLTAIFDEIDLDELEKEDIELEEDGSGEPGDDGNGNDQPPAAPPLPVHKVIDGDTDYAGAIYDAARDDAIDAIKTDGDLQGEIGNAIEEYFSSIHK